MEGRPEYKIPGEEGLIAKWKKGELDISGNANWQKWNRLRLKRRRPKESWSSA